MKQGDFRAIRLIRTAHSERYVFHREGTECAALDLHYLPTGVLAGTVVVYRESGLSDDEIPRLLQQIDEDLLPEAEQGDGRLFFTVVRGDVLGSFCPEAEEAPPAASL